MHTFVVISLALLGLAHAGPDCSSMTDCYGCAKQCHWCHRDNRCHAPSWVSFIDPCFVHGDDIEWADKCPNQPVSNASEWAWSHCSYEWPPLRNNCQCAGKVRFGRGDVWSEAKDVMGTVVCDTWHFDDPLPGQAKECQCQQPPNPATPPSNNTFAKDLLKMLFRKLHISVNVDKCVNDVGNSEVHFQDFAIDVKHKKYDSSLEELARAISALANSVSSCGVQEIQQKLDSIAAAIRFAKISTSALDHGVEVVVGAVDLWKDLEAVQAAIMSKDANAIGDALEQLLSGWSSIEGGCQSGQTVCKVVDGLLKVIAVTAKEVGPCEETLKPVVQTFQQAASLFGEGRMNFPDGDDQIKRAVAKFAEGLEQLSKATLADACGLKQISGAIGDLSPKLAAAIVKVEGATKISIIVGSADVYDELFTMMQDFGKRDYTGVGVQLGMLLAKLKASGCATEMCSVVIGLFGSLQVGFADIEACSADLDTTKPKLQALLDSLQKKAWKSSLLALGDLVKQIGDDVNACGVTSIGGILQDTASKLHADSLALDLGVVIQFLAKGVDITPDIQKIIVDSTNGQWGALGSDLGTLSTWLTSVKCNSFTCKIMEGLLGEASISLKELKPCEDTLRVAETDFQNGAELWGHHQYKEGLSYWAAGVNQLAKSVDACGLPAHLKFLEQEANVMGLGNVSGVDRAISILVHGKDISEELFDALQSFGKQDYRSAGGELQKAVSGLYEWTNGHLCTSDACYTFNGILQFMSDFAMDMKSCKADFEGVFSELKEGFHLLTSDKSKQLKGFTHNLTAIEAGMGHIGNSFTDMSKTVSDCHLEELAELLAQLGVKLKISPQLAVVEETLTILIHGVAIEKEIAEALQDFSDKNWPGFGYMLMKLVKHLLKIGAKEVVESSTMLVV